MDKEGDQQEEGLTTRRAWVGGAFALGGAVGLTARTHDQTPRPAESDVLGADRIVYQPSDRGGHARPLAKKLAEQVSLLDFDVDPQGKNDSSAGFKAALQEAQHSRLFIPDGTYLVENLSVLGSAGRQIIGQSRWRTVLRTEAGAGPLFASEVAAGSTSSFHLISDFLIDLNGQDRIAIDLASINMSTIQRIHIRGSQRKGVGVRFAAPLRKGAYDNSIYDCSFEGLRQAVTWGVGANNNSAYNCRAIDCDTAFDAAPGEVLNASRVFGGRVEKCRIGLREGAECGGYFGIRFEDCTDADIEFTETSRNASIWGGYTGGSRVVLKNLQLATSPSIDGGALGYFEIEESQSRPKISTGRHVFGGAGKAPEVHPLPDYAAFFHDYVLMGKGAGVEFSNAAGDNRILAMFANSVNELSIAGMDRATKTGVTINLGLGPAVRPLSNGVTDLGSQGRAYKGLHLTDGIYIGGRRVLSGRQAPIANDPSGTSTAAKVNQILSALRRLGLIES